MMETRLIAASPPMAYRKSLRPFGRDRRHRTAPHIMSTLKAAFAVATRTNCGPRIGRNKLQEKCLPFRNIDSRTSSSITLNSPRAIPIHALNLANGRQTSTVGGIYDSGTTGRGGGSMADLEYHY